MLKWLQLPADFPGNEPLVARRVVSCSFLEFPQACSGHFRLEETRFRQQGLGWFRGQGVGLVTHWDGVQSLGCKAWGLGLGVWGFEV